jgi:hypothetical protein
LTIIFHATELRLDCPNISIVAVFFYHKKVAMANEERIIDNFYFVFSAFTLERGCTIVIFMGGFFEFWTRGEESGSNLNFS